jgi:signal transduction histidine kinase
VELSVKNTGPLIPEKTAANLFGKYVRGAGGKRGMGLYFSRLVAEAHGGQIRYESTDVGPRFAIRLPGRA